MSNNQTPAPTAASPGEIPVDLLASSSQTAVNPWEVPLKTRKVTGGPAQKAVREGIITDDDYVIVRTRANPSGTRVKRKNLPGNFSVSAIARNTISAEVATKKLMNSKGEFARDQYNPDREAEAELAKMTDKNRLDLLNNLYRRGFFPGKQGPSITGRDSRSVYAMAQFLAAANPTGYTWDVAKSSIFSQYAPIQGLPGTGGGKAKVKQYSVTSDKDISSVADRVAQEIIGRKLSDSDISKIVSRVQTAEKNAGLTEKAKVVQAPSAQAVTEGIVEKKYGQESAMMRFGELGSSIDALLKGM